MASRRWYQGVAWAAFITGAVAEATDVLIERQARCARVQQFHDRFDPWTNWTQAADARQRQAMQ
jgi:hypothetical protein